MRLYRQATLAAVGDALGGDGSMPAKPELDQIGKQVRLELEQTLGRAIRDDVPVRQLSMATIRFG